MTHVEHDCCPPADHPIDEPPLDGPALDTLKARIEAAAAGPYHFENGLPTAEGSRSGTLQACTAAKVGVIIRDVARNDRPGGFDALTVNDAPEAQEIRDFVEAIVLEDMY